MATELVLKALGDEFSVIHLDTADRRGLSNIGRIDLTNVVLAAYHGLKCLALLLLKRPQIVYVPIGQNSLAFLRDSLFLIPARFLRAKLVVHLHGSYFGTFYRTSSRPVQWLIRFALGKSDRAIVLGTALRSLFHGVIPADRIRVVPNGIPDSFGSFPCGPTNGHERTILFLSTLKKEKGALDVLKALPRITEYLPNLRAVFAGEWSCAQDKQAAARMVREHKLESCVEFVGPIAPPRKFEVLKSASLFVLPTYNEGQPYAVLEAMSAGLPVISTNVGCIPDTVTNGVNGFVLEPGDHEALADKVVLLLTDQNLRRRMGEASRKRFLESYTYSEFSVRMQNIFKELVD